MLSINCIICSIVIFLDLTFSEVSLNIPDGNGNWVDRDGNTYRFVNNEDVYDQNDVDYYWHGEGADVYYMPVE